MSDVGHRTIIDQIEELDRQRRALVRQLTGEAPAGATTLGHVPRWWDVVEAGFVTGVRYQEFEYVVDDAGDLWVGEDHGDWPTQVPRWVLEFAVDASGCH
jgi:hypothetical protein